MRSALRAALLVGAGGFFGSLLRYLVSSGVHRLLPGAFPWGTLTVNVTGCLCIGALSGLVLSRHAFTPELRLFLLVGVLGGFTTFSTFGYEAFALSRNGEHLHAGASILANVLAGLGAVWAGYTLTTLQ